MSSLSKVTARVARQSHTAYLFRASEATSEPSEASLASIAALRGARHGSSKEGPLGLVAPGSIEGLCAAVAVAYFAGCAGYPLRLHVAETCQPALGETLVEVAEDEGLARRLLAGFERTTSPGDAKRAIYVCQSDDPGRGQALMDYLRYGFTVHQRLWNHRAHPSVAGAFDVAYTVSNECEHARQFVRFHKTSHGIYYARFEPSANVVPLVIGHFAARFNTQPFLIHDPLHHVAGVWDGSQIQLVSTAGSAWEDGSSVDALGIQDDRYYQALWKRFYDSVAIESRTNHDLRRHFMPLRFWKNLPEMDPRLDDEGSLARTHHVAAAPAPVGKPIHKHPALEAEKRGASIPMQASN